MAYHVSKTDFADLVERALDELPERFREFLVRNQPPGNPDSLVEAHQMRAGERVNAVPARL